ncbi:MAG: LCP family protein [Geodermatophilaceae bacterium]|nr:LCP family protein [Geodermatophilaceae bacterium]
MTDGYGGGRELPAYLNPRAGPGTSTPGSTDARPARSPRSGGGGQQSSRIPRGGLFLGVRLVAGLLSLTLLGASGWGWYLTQVAEQNLSRQDVIPTDGNDNAGGGDVDAMNILIVGNDNRTNLTPEQLAQLGVSLEPGINTDTMILLHVPADGSRASFVSFPRDSYVEVPGYGTHKLNSAFSLGFNEAAPAGSTDQERAAFGARKLIQTISSISGVSIDHYVSVDLFGFVLLTDIVGGVPVNLCQAQQEPKSGINLPAGAQELSGPQALAFVRQRDGLPRGDLDRIVRQQVFIGGMVSTLLSQEVFFDLGLQRDLVEAASQALTVDSNLDLFGLAEQMQAVTAGTVNFQTMPNRGVGTEDGLSIVVPEDRDVLYDFFANLTAEDDAVPPAPDLVGPGEVSVAVFNGSGTGGLAAETQTELEAAGFVVTSTGNADSNDYSQTEIRYAEGQESEAATLAAAIPGAVVRADPTVGGAEIQLVLGSDFNGVGQAVDAAPPADPDDQETPRTAADTGCIN